MGFILRYPEDKTEVTGIGYEPWHYRYVGRETAKAIQESGLCLEEYLQALSLPTSVESAALDGIAGEQAGVSEEAAQTEAPAKELSVAETDDQELKALETEAQESNLQQDAETGETPAVEMKLGNAVLDPNGL